MSPASVAQPVIVPATVPRLAVQALSLPQLLQAHERFFVPAHQRVYGWGAAQVERLLGDTGIKVIARGQARLEPDSRQWLFLGTIYLSRRDDSTAIDIADGQQRVVTISMIYAVARDLESDDRRRSALSHVIADPACDGANAAARFRLVLKDVDAAFFRRWVQEPGATLRPFVAQTQATEAGDDEHAQLSAAGAMPSSDDDASDHLRRLSQSQRNIIENRDLIVERLEALGIEGRRRLIENLAQQSEVIVITAASIDQARHAYASTYKRGLRQSETDIIRTEIIGAAEDSLRPNLAYHWDECEARLGQDALEQFLELLVLIKSGKPPARDLQIGLMAAFGLPERVKPFIEGEFAPNAAIYKQIIETSIETGSGFFNPVRDRRRIRRINGQLVSMMRLGHHEWRAPAMVALTTLRGELDALEDVLAGLERLAAVQSILGIDSSQAIERYVGVARAIPEGREAALKSLELTPQTCADARDMLSATTFGTKARFRMAILLKLNDLAAGDVIKIDPKSVSVEHILPQNTHRKSDWRKAFRHPKSGKFDGGQYLHQLGNLTLLSHADNRRAGNEEYAIKRPILRASDYPLANAAGAKKVWTAKTVEVRGAALFQSLVRHWRL